MIVENENKGENLIDFTGVYESGVSPNKWDDIFLLLKEKKERKGDKTYDGYYIDEYVELYDSDVTELKYLVKLGDTLDLFRTPIKSLPMLSYVGGSLDLRYAPIESLPMLEYVGKDLNLSNTQIESLPMLSYVGLWLDLRDTPLSYITTKEELRSKINIRGTIYL